METSEASDDYTDKLDNDVALARLNKEWRVEYMKTLLHDMDVRNEGRAEGKAEGKAEAIISILEECGEVPEELKNKIYLESDMNRLNKWVKLSATVSSADEFEEKMNII